LIEPSNWRIDWTAIHLVSACAMVSRIVGIPLSLYALTLPVSIAKCWHNEIVAEIDLNP